MLCAVGDVDGDGRGGGRDPRDRDRWQAMSTLAARRRARAFLARRDRRASTKRSTSTRWRYPSADDRGAAHFPTSAPRPRDRLPSARPRHHPGPGRVSSDQQLGASHARAVVVSLARIPGSRSTSRCTSAHCSPCSGTFARNGSALDRRRGRHRGASAHRDGGRAARRLSDRRDDSGRDRRPRAREVRRERVPRSAA